jgi:patatin-like phospholipase/acyl hydrolase
MSRSIKRILSIDGGGIKGLFAAAFLAGLEEILSVDSWRFFDLIVGTSTGGILALGMGSGLTAGRIVNFYQMYGPTIFHRSLKSRILAPLFRSRYDPSTMRAALQTVFGPSTLEDSRCRLVIPSMNLETGEVHLYKTAHHQRFQTDYKSSMVEVALATSAAPTYFPAHRSETGPPLIDGGLWANNPAGLAVVEAISILGWEPDSLRLLSVGCPSTPLNVDWGRRHNLGTVYWGWKMLDLFLAGQSSASIGTAQHLGNL